MAKTNFLIQRPLKDRTFLQKRFGKVRQYTDVATLAAKAERVDDPKFIEESHGTAGKMFSAAYGIADGEFNNQISAVSQRAFGTQIFIHHGRSAALDKITAHHNNAVICIGKLFCSSDVISMSVMKRIVFRNDSDRFHGFLISPETTYIPAFSLPQCEGFVLFFLENRSENYLSMKAELGIM